MKIEAPLTFTIHTGLADFCALLVPWLEKDEAKYALPLGLCFRLMNTPRVDPRKLLLASVSTPAGELRASALRIPGHYLIVQSEPLCAEALELLARSLAENNVELSGVTGVSDASSDFARRWEACTGAAPKLETRQRAYALRELNPLREATGDMEQARFEHTWLVLKWINAMIDETATGNQSAWTLLEVHVSIRNHQFYLWCVGDAPAAMAYFNRPTRRSVAICGVYTAPEKRGRGYATALVAEMCKQALAEGRETVTLFTDAENPISNAVYRRVGFYPVCEYHQFQFWKPETP